MFEFISNILTSIGNFFSTVWDFLIHFFEEIVYVVKLLGTVIISIPSYFTWLPGSVISLIVLGIGIVVIYKIMGREG